MKSSTIDLDIYTLQSGLKFYSYIIFRMQTDLYHIYWFLFGCYNCAEESNKSLIEKMTENYVQLKHAIFCQQEWLLKFD